ncbi:MAG: hypothetical protein ATN34_03725 [Epulopiscium sp. Nele67-Bin002]|nr:MAG: hypothetical protein BEN18_10635 [Epulopiscium sp. Nuni2H_MBin001]OON92434.1 MAG: hypothetical protein ATN34_03725 [Epulopiscium sp. Nele67-Bin002]OON93531.1 MAG: hypothetical protein ATN33_05625 [Epulopiscium sp. Nele67-Bin001]
MKIEGAIFDMDGTLLDSMLIWRGVGEKYLRSRGCEPNEDINARTKTLSLEQSMQFFRDEYGIEDTEEIFIASTNKILADQYAIVKLKEGVLELLDEFKAAGVKMCVATVTPRPLVEVALKSTGIIDYFSKIFTCSEVGYGKDNAAIFEKALEELGTTKENTVIFEDALHAIKTAKDANFKVVGVYEATAPDDQGHIKELVDYYIQSFQGLPSKLTI